MFLHPARVRPSGKPLELYFQRMLPSKGSALVRCVFFSQLSIICSLSFFICVSLCCASLTHRSPVSLSVCILFYYYFSLTFMLSSLVFVISGYSTVSKSGSEIWVRCYAWCQEDGGKKLAQYTCVIDKKLTAAIYTIVTILLNAAIMLQPKTFQRILLWNTFSYTYERLFAFKLLFKTNKKIKI